MCWIVLELNHVNRLDRKYWPTMHSLYAVHVKNEWLNYDEDIIQVFIVVAVVIIVILVRVYPSWANLRSEYGDHRKPWEWTWQIGFFPQRGVLPGIRLGDVHQMWRINWMHLWISCCLGGTRGRMEPVLDMTTNEI
jgi:hypothetical protein